MTGELTARVRTKAQEAVQHDLEMTALAEASWEIASDLDSKRAMDYVLNKIASLLSLSEVAVISHAEDGKLEAISAHGLSKERTELLFDDKTAPAIGFVFQRALPLGPRATQYPNLISAGQAYQNAADYAQLDATILPIYVEGIVSAVLYIRSDSALPPNRREHQ